jgi:hypothetical protein
MTRSRFTCTGVIGLASVAVMLGGCANMGRSKAMDTERLLMAAGFQMRLADSDEKLAQLEKLPQRTTTAGRSSSTQMRSSASASTWEPKGPIGASSGCPW